MKTCNKFIIFTAYPTSCFISVSSVFMKCENGPPTWNLFGISAAMLLLNAECKLIPCFHSPNEALITYYNTHLNKCFKICINTRMYYWFFFSTTQRLVEFICWNTDAKCFYGGGSTHRPCLKKTLSSALTVLWKKLNKIEEQKWRSIVVLLGAKCQNILGDKTRGSGCLCLRGA